VAREFGGSGVAEYVIATHYSADDLAFYKRVGMRPIDVQRPPAPAIGMASGRRTWPRASAG
jgi:hypothetical protein